MSRKHFKHLAEVLCSLKPRRSTSQKILWDTIVVEIAMMCEEHNDRFDRDKFYEACERSL